MPKQRNPAERLAALQEQLKAAKEDLKTAEQKRFQIIGAALVTLLKSDAELKAAVLPKLQTAVTNPREKEAIAILFV